MYPLHMLDRVLDAWIYGMDPLTFLRLGEHLEAFRQRYRDDPKLFERMIRERLLANPHRLRIRLRPDPELQERTDTAFTERMRTLRSTPLRRRYRTDRRAGGRAAAQQQPAQQPGGAGAAAAACRGRPAGRDHAHRHRRARRRRGRPPAQRRVRQRRQLPGAVVRPGRTARGALALRAALHVGAAQARRRRTGLRGDRSAIGGHHRRHRRLDRHRLPCRGAGAAGLAADRSPQGAGRPDGGGAGAAARPAVRGRSRGPRAAARGHGADALPLPHPTGAPGPGHRPDLRGARHERGRLPARPDGRAPAARPVRRGRGRVRRSRRRADRADRVDPRLPAEPRAAGGELHRRRRRLRPCLHGPGLLDRVDAGRPGRRHPPPASPRCRLRVPGWPARSRSPTAPR